MPILHVVVVATREFSPFHFSVPSMVFDKAMPEQGLFSVSICAEQPGLVKSDIGISINVEHGLELIDSADIVIVPFWEHPESIPPHYLLESLRNAWERGAEVVGYVWGRTFSHTQGC